MAMEFSTITAISLLLLLAQTIKVQSGVFDVTKYGAKVGNTDISQVRIYTANLRRLISIRLS